PASINGIGMALFDLIGSLDIIARAHGVDEALRVLSAAHHHLQQTVAPKSGGEVRQRYIAIIDRGDWFAPARAPLDAAVAKAQDKVSGAVRLKVFEGRCEIVSCQPSKPSKKLSVLA